MAYSTKDDLLVGALPIDRNLSPDKFVGDAADEIDSKIGMTYQTPIDISDTTKVVRPAVLLLKRINNFLASGRLIMAMDIKGEDRSLHAYGMSLVKEALAALEQIACREIPLEGADLLDQNTKGGTGPRILNQDSSSAVEAFYSRVMPKYPATQYPIIRLPNDGTIWAPDT